MKFGESGGAETGAPGIWAMIGSTAYTGADGRLAPGPITGSPGATLNSEFAIEAIHAGSGAWPSRAAARSSVSPRGNPDSSGIGGTVLS